METQTEFHKDGRINTYPCSFELGQQITANGGTVKYKASVVVDKEGNTSITPYQTGCGKRYVSLFKTSHGVVKETSNDIIVKFQFSKNNDPFLITGLIDEEMEQIFDYIENTKDVKEWQ